ncbi:hypothetical protein DFH94DRAFT_715233 [Russula ochroleuca]|jgi:hypothetical protein|uniref:Uncharacterized protein n=1 Tax=Russula ochroleuca TaxID=152965 RepID=A0A9P5N231_9AGAM|nr:hypothetical protein DFH94DRAFT_715233 [Russula ochroleuca]
MANDNCSDCGLANDLHVREDGIYGCPRGASISGSLCQRCHEPSRLHTDHNVCPGRYVSTLHDTFSEYTNSSVRSESPDPLLLAPNKQLSQRYYLALRRSTQHEGVIVPSRRSSRVENRQRSRGVEPYAHAQARRSSLKMAEDPIRHSRSRRISMQDSMPSSHRSYENEAVFPAHNHPPCRKSLQPYVLDRMVPAEDMDPIEGFRPFTEIDPGQRPDPVTIREPMRDIVRPPFQFVWNPSVVVPAVGGMRVRVGQFERGGHPTGDITPFASSSTAHENETDASMSDSEDYFTVQDWSSSSTPEHHSPSRGKPIDTFSHVASPPSLPGPSLTEFIQESVQQQTLAGGSGYTYSQSVGNEFPQFEALAQHYAAVQDQKRRLAPLQLQPLPYHATGPTPSTSALASRPFDHPESPGSPCPHQIPRDVAPFQYPFTPTPTPTAPRPPQIEQPHAVDKPRRRSTMPCTLPDATITDYRSESTPSVPDRAPTEPAVDEDEDWATREPWEYVHRVLTTSTRPLVMFLKTPTADLPAVALAALGADLHLQTMLIDNEHWLLIGPRDVNLYEFGVRFQKRARTQDKFVFRLGNLNWGADVNEIEDEVCKAAMECSRRGRGIPAMLPAQFMAGAMGGFVVWYALSLM